MSVARALQTGGVTREPMNAIAPLHRPKLASRSLAPLIVCLTALALPAAWDLAQSRNLSDPTLSLLHFGAMPSASSCSVPVNAEPKDGQKCEADQPTKISNSCTRSTTPSLPSIRVNFSDLLR